jgi:hypothetical protein
MTFCAPLRHYINKLILPYLNGHFKCLTEGQFNFGNLNKSKGEKQKNLG